MEWRKRRFYLSVEAGHCPQWASRQQVRAGQSAGLPGSSSSSATYRPSLKLHATTASPAEWKLHAPSTASAAGRNHVRRESVWHKYREHRKRMLFLFALCFWKFNLPCVPMSSILEFSFLLSFFLIFE